MGILRESKYNGKIYRWVPIIISVLIIGTSLLAWVLLDEPGVDLQTELALSAFFALCALAGDLWIKFGGTDITRKREPRIATWSLAWIVLFGALVLVINVAEGPGIRPDLIAGLALGTSIGLVVGITTGGLEARAVQQAIAMEEIRVHNERSEAERDRLDYLNSLLRHEVLNDASIIKGNLALALDEYVDHPEARSRLETAVDRTDSLVETTKDVRVLIELASNEVELRPTDLTEQIRDQARELRSIFPAVVVEEDLEEGLTTMGDDLLPRMLSNLMINAVEHNDSDPPRVSLAAREADGNIVVTIADNGSGFDPEERAALFERGREDHGVGLYLVDKLAERYDGRIELTETGEAGSTFRITLPSVAPEPRGADDGDPVGEQVAF